MRAAAVSVCAAGLAFSLAPAAQAAQASGCRYYYTSWFTGPNGQTTGSGEYAEGDRDPEGRICENGWWVSPQDERDGGPFGL
ncbi:hypothetical protein ACIRQY_32060 [Streptomyces sp. NPDC101490]|uniref:hypothetical protein n=1 Tax=unclassified Streptomyces TaxID=2593676 RepID=UPI0033188C1E